MTTLELKLSEPENTWLPVSFKHEDYECEFYCSSVPTNPLHDLLDALHAVLSGQDRRVWWHLEPAGYYFEFATTGEETELRILFSKDSTAIKQSLEYTMKTASIHIVMPMWRALNAFYYSGYSGWGAAPLEDLGSLKSKIKQISRES